MSSKAVKGTKAPSDWLVQGSEAQLYDQPNDYLLRRSLFTGRLMRKFTPPL